MTPFVRIATYDNVLELTLDRNEKRNAIDRTMLDALSDAIARFADDVDLRVMLIRAEGAYFSAGADVTSLQLPDLNGSSSRFRHAYRNGSFPIQLLLDEMEAIEKPIVVAHQGPCLGGALELSLSCDFRLAGRSATYGLPEAAMGLLPGSGGTSRLTRLVGPHWARWLIIAGRQFDATQALAVGLVHELFEDDALDAGARAFCVALARQPSEMIAAAKLAIELCADLDRNQSRNVERLANSSLIFGDEHRTRMAQLHDRMFARRRDDEN